ncbi:MAG: rubrerythrin family protein [Alphaproteobacteria bacterium]|nr:rubrerythrin family protein [Alphaproteobacteria bacterium]
MFSRFFTPGKRKFQDLSEQEILALAISSEEDDARIYLAYAEGLRADYPDSAKVFEDMADEEGSHRKWLIDLHKKRFGETIPLVRRTYIQGYFQRKPDWLIRPLNIEKTRKMAEEMEAQAQGFYLAAVEQCTDADTRKLLGDLAEAEANHASLAHKLGLKHVPETVAEMEAAKEHRQFILTFVQPGLAGLMDGSVSTLAPIFAAAFATGDTWQTFLVGLSASIGAGISMGFTEVASDDGKLSGRGSPIKRGFAAGIMTTLGGLGHALPYLITDFWQATSIAIVVVFIELWLITWIQHKYMETPWLRASFQVALGGALVFAAGVLIGNA